MTETLHGIDEAVEGKVREMRMAECPVDDTIAWMRQAGLHKISCIKLVRKYWGVSLGEAKDLVHLSPAWDDVRERDDRFHDALEEGLEQEGWTRTNFVRDGLSYTSFTTRLKNEPEEKFDQR